MIDNNISKGNWAYQFRVDILTTLEEYQEQLGKMLTEQEFADWICCLEKGEKTNKLHYQCILWHKDKFHTNKMQALKSKYFRKNRNQRNAISFTDAKKIVNLSSYVMKDNEKENEVISSLTIEQREKIPKWLTKEAMKNKWKNEVEEYMELICREPVCDTIYNTMKHLIKYYLHHDHAPPNKHTVYKLLLKHHPEYNIMRYINDFILVEN